MTVADAHHCWGHPATQGDPRPCNCGIGNDHHHPPLSERQPEPGGIPGLTEAESDALWAALHDDDARPEDTK